MRQCCAGAGGATRPAKDPSFALLFFLISCSFIFPVLFFCGCACSLVCFRLSLVHRVRFVLWIANFWSGILLIHLLLKENYVLKIKGKVVINSSATKKGKKGESNRTETLFRKGSSRCSRDRVGSPGGGRRGCGCRRPRVRSPMEEAEPLIVTFVVVRLLEASLQLVESFGLSGGARGRHSRRCGGGVSRGRRSGEVEHGWGGGS
jgi:hypothetical protein